MSEVFKVLKKSGFGGLEVACWPLEPKVAGSRYGEVKDLRDEAWSKSYRYKISNGIRIATMNLKEHIPSYMTIASQKVIISYEGQPATCYGCNNTGHQIQDCPTRKIRTQRPLNQTMTP
jgi:hypothetical protein